MSHLYPLLALLILVINHPTSYHPSNSWMAQQVPAGFKAFFTWVFSCFTSSLCSFCSSVESHIWALRFFLLGGISSKNGSQNGYWCRYCSGCLKSLLWGRLKVLHEYHWLSPSWVHTVYVYLWIHVYLYLYIYI